MPGKIIADTNTGAVPLHSILTFGSRLSHRHEPPLQHLGAAWQGTPHRIPLARTPDHYHRLHSDRSQCSSASPSIPVPLNRARGAFGGGLLVAGHSFCRIPDASVVLPAGAEQRYPQLRLRLAITDPFAIFLAQLVATPTLVPSSSPNSSCFPSSPFSTTFLIAPQHSRGCVLVLVSRQPSRHLPLPARRSPPSLRRKRACANCFCSH